MVRCVVYFDGVVGAVVFVRFFYFGFRFGDGCGDAVGFRRFVCCLLWLDFWVVNSVDLYDFC